MNMNPLIRLDYCFVFFSLPLIFLTTIIIGAKEAEDIIYPPCYFNPLCTCSKVIPDLGIVRCRDVHMPRIPEAINTSKVFILHLENNGLRTLEPSFLQSTGLYKLTVSFNPIALIPDGSFSGLERSLWELILSHNQLIRVPNRAMRYLRKLRVLDLSDNDISEILPGNWRGLESSLDTLILSANALSYLAVDSFAGLSLLSSLDLRGNNLREIDPNVFKEGLTRLSELYLSDNQLSFIPYEALQPLKLLRTVDLSYNNINNMQPANAQGNVIQSFNFTMNLNLLKLDYNQISHLDAWSFRYFDTLNITYLDGNPLQVIKENAFRQAKIRELYIRFCGLLELAPTAFSGLENYINILDLSSNNLIMIPENLFYRMDNLRVLSLRDNLLAGLNLIKMFNVFQYSLYELNLSGSENQPIAIQDLRSLRNLRHLSLSRLPQPHVRPEDFIEFRDLENLKIISAGLQTVKNHAFQYVHSLKRIDFSDNSISSIENEAFAEIGHSLISLKLSSAFTNEVTEIPYSCFEPLHVLKHMDLSNNKIINMPDTCFHSLKNLVRLQLGDNSIQQLQKGTFQGDIHLRLQEIILSFNNIKHIQQHTFVDLISLEQIHLDDNHIESIDRRSFMNLEKLKRLNLKGNKINFISYEAFQNLPALEDLDVSYNNLNNFEFQMFDQVGTLSIFKVNLSYNKIMDLITKLGAQFENGIHNPSLHSNIKILDLSFNNITYIGKNFFQPAMLSLTQLDLSHNAIQNATKNVFGNIPHLYWLDISHNKILQIDFDVFRNTKKLQVFRCSHNVIADIPLDLFRFMLHLRIVDLSYNRLRFLPDNLFREDGLEVLDVSHNQFNKIPLNSFNAAAAATICEMNLAWNSISSVADGLNFNRFQSLSKIDLSYNRLMQIDIGAYKYLTRLTYLDMSHNSQLMLERNGRSFSGIEYTLLHLKLDNVSLTYVPELPLPNLLSLSLAYNFLPTVPSEMSVNISSLRALNLNYNDLTTVPIVTKYLTKLRKLSLKANPITILSNTSLLGVAQHLEVLDISNFDLNKFEGGALYNMYALRTLIISDYKYTTNLNLPKVLSFTTGLRNLEIHVDQSVTNLDLDLQGDFPPKLKNITLSGRGFNFLSPSIFKGLKSPTLHFCLRNTSVSNIPRDLFYNLGRARNLSIDVRFNEQLENLENPSTGHRPELRGRTFLTDLKILGNRWHCDCQLGWIEVWQRKKRQYICGTTPSQQKFFNSEDYHCRQADDDIRNALCINEGNESMLEMLKSNIECGWSAASNIQGIVLLLWSLLLILLMSNNYLNNLEMY